ncbi:MAG: hypothetical protein ACWGMY_01965 [Hyphomicrobiaceae bacterium]
MNAQSAQAGWSRWLGKGQYQAYFNYQLSVGRYPAKVQIGNFDGHVCYRANFHRIPQGANFVSHHGLGDAAFSKSNANLARQGYRRISRDRMEYDGGVINMGTWIRY